VIRFTGYRAFVDQVGKATLLTSALLVLGSSAAAGQDATELAKSTQNPVGDVVSVPLQFNFNGGGALDGQTYFNLNVQPVMPIRLTSRVSLIFRTIVPFHSFPAGGASDAQNGGFGDIQEQLFFTPAKPGKLIWGVGPMFSLATATAVPAQTGTWAGGLSAVVLAMPGPWVVGSLVSQLWPMHDTGGAPETNVFSWQYFVNYNFGHGWALSSVPTIVANWDAPDGQQWTVPFGAGITKTLILKGQPMSLGFQFFKNVKKPDDAPSTLARFNVSFIFPMKR
jgi:hypothetical protein